MLNGLRKNAKPALQRNSDLLSGRLLDKSELPTTLAAFFRFNAHGELINMIHLRNLIMIAEHNPHCNFALWTKRTDLIRKYLKDAKKPKNLILVYSNPKINRIMTNPPKHFDKVFNNVDKDYQVDKHNCTGQKCASCLACYKHNGYTVIVEAVKKR